MVAASVMVDRVSPLMAVKKYDLATLLEACQERPDLDPCKYFVDAFTNPNPHARVEIASWILDRGADVNQTIGRDKTGALHVLFQQRNFDSQLEAPLVQLLLEAGIDINAYSPRWGTPLQVLRDNTGLAEADLEPLYDVIFAHPGIDWNVPVSLKGADEKQTLRDRVESDAAIRPEMVRRMAHYLENPPTTLHA